MLSDMCHRLLCQGHTNTDTGAVSLDADGGAQDPDAYAISHQVMLLHTLVVLYHTLAHREIPCIFLGKENTDETG